MYTYLVFLPYASKVYPPVYMQLPIQGLSLLSSFYIFKSAFTPVKMAKELDKILIYMRRLNANLTETTRRAVCRRRRPIIE